MIGRLKKGKSLKKSPKTYQQRTSSPEDEHHSEDGEGEEENLPHDIGRKQSSTSANTKGMVAMANGITALGKQRQEAVSLLGSLLDIVKDSPGLNDEVIEKLNTAKSETERLIEEESEFHSIISKVKDFCKALKKGVEGQKNMIKDYHSIIDALKKDLESSKKELKTLGLQTMEYERFEEWREELEETLRDDFEAITGVKMQGKSHSREVKSR